MSITIVSTDTPEQVLKAQGNAGPAKAGSGPSAAEAATVSDDNSVADVNASAESQSENEAIGVSETSESTESNEEENESDESDSEHEESNEEPSRKKKKGSAKRRIDKLIARNSNLEQEKEYWREQTLKSQKTPNEPQKSVESKADKPKRDDFENQDEYLEKLVEWKADQKLAERDRKEKETQIVNSVRSKEQALVKKVEAFKKDHTDYQDRFDEVKDIPMSQSVRHALLECENGAAVFYEMAQDREEYERICTMEPLAAQRAIGRIEARIESRTVSSETQKLKTNAKRVAAINPLGGKPTPPKKNPGDMSMPEYIRYREAQIKASGRG